MNLQECNLRVGDVAAMLKVSPMTVIRWSDNGDLYCIKVGASRRYRQEDIDAFISSKNYQKKKQDTEPVYNDTPPDECGFEDDTESRKRELTEQCIKLGVMLETKKASEVKAPVQERQPDKPYVGPYPSGFYQTGIAELLSAYDDDETDEK